MPSAPALQEPAIATAPPAAAKPEDSGGKAAPMPTDLIAPPKLESSGAASPSSADATSSAQSLFESTCAVCQGGKLEGGKPPRP
ncbi:hypothetical protein ACFQI7_24170 [Paenibacillus allorhizosphaerae]|nr:hypothetical protein [Paenibacillus allorhizosphaerae]